MIHLDYSSSNPIYLQIKENIKKLILSGGLQENEPLPSVRTLASTLAINVNTVIRAYHELETEGYIYTMQGKGNFVSEKNNVREMKKKELFDTLDSLVQMAKQLGVTREELTEHIEEKF